MQRLLTHAVRLRPQRGRVQTQASRIESYQWAGTS